MTKKKRRHITVGELQPITDNLKDQLSNSLRLLDKARSIIREKDVSIVNLRLEVERLETEKTLLFKIKKWFGQKWKR